MTLDERCAETYREHPFHTSPNFVQALKRIITSSDFDRATEIL